MTKFPKVLVLTLVLSGGGYAAVAATSPTEIVSPVCIQGPATIKMNTNPNIWCEGGKVVHLAGATAPSMTTADGQTAVAALSRLVGGKPLRCEAIDFDQPVVDARCWNDNGEDIGARLRSEGYLR